MNALPSTPATLFLICQSPGDLRLLEILGEENPAFSEVYAYYDPETFLQEFHSWKAMEPSLDGTQAFVLLDSGLPLEGARYLLDHLRENYTSGELPVILLSSAIYPSYSHSEVLQGANDMLELPCSLPELRASLGNCFSAYLA